MPTPFDTPLDMQSAQGLLPATSMESLLGQYSTLRQQPLIPANNPLLAIGSALSGFGAGVQGQPNPALQMLQSRRQQQLGSLEKEAELRSEVDKRAMEKQKAVMTMQLDLAKSLLQNQKDNPMAIKAAIGTYNALGLTKYSSQDIEAIAAHRSPEVVTKELKLVLGALDAGVDPEMVLPGSGRKFDLQKLTALTPEQRLDLAGPDAKKAFLDAQEKSVDVEAKRLIAGIKKRAAEGQPVSPTELRVAGLTAGSPDQVVGELLGSYLSGNPLQPESMRLIKQWEMNNKIKNANSDAQLAMMASMGDKTAQAAWDKMASADRLKGETKIKYDAAMTKAKMEADPAYQPTLEERAAMKFAEAEAAKKNAKPLPNAIEKQLTSGQNVLESLKAIKGIHARTKGRYVGPVAGPAGEIAEKFSSLPFMSVVSEEDRADLMTRLAFIFKELNVGAEGFGTALTAAEIQWAKKNAPLMADPDPLFSKKVERLEQFLVRKYKNKIDAAVKGQYLVPDHMVTYLDDYAGPKNEQQDVQGRIDALRAAKVPKEEIWRRIQAGELFK